MRQPPGQKPIRVLLADDHSVVRQGFRLILSQVPGIEVVGEASNGREAVDLARELQPCVVVLDIAMPVLNGVEATRLIRQECPECNVLVLSMHKDAAYVRSHFDAIEARVGDAPRPNEIVVAVAVTDSGRPLARVGGLSSHEIKGQDGLR